jgi:hypothetical protein
MPNKRISEEKRNEVSRLWLLGKTRAEINRTTGVSSGEISNIIADFKKRLDNYDPEPLKDLSRALNEEHVTPSQSAIGFRIHKMIIGMGGDDEKIELFVSSLQKECIQKVSTVEVVPSLQATIDFSKKGSIPISEVPDQLKKYEIDLANIRAGIEAAKADRKKAFQDARLTEEIVRDFIVLELKLNAVGLTTKAPDAIVTVALNVEALGRDPKKIFVTLSKIKSFASMEREHQQECAYWEDRAKIYSRIYQVARWFVLNGYLPADLELLQSIINKIARRERITSEVAKNKLFMAIISYAALDGLTRQANALNGRIIVLQNERDGLLDSVATSRYLVNAITLLVREIGLTGAKAVIDTMCEVLTSPYYSSNPPALLQDLTELRKRRREEQLQRQQRECDDIPKAKDQNNRRPLPATPALPERIDRLRGIHSDQSRKDEGGAVCGERGMENNTHETTVRDGHGEGNDSQDNNLEGQET